MAAKYRKICPKIWNDEKFVSLSDDGKLVFFFLLTHPHMTPLGAMRGTSEGFASELGWTNRRLSDALGEALAHGIVKANRKASCMSIPNFLKYNQPESVNVVKAWIGCVDDIPECDLKNECLVNAQRLMVSKSVAFADAFAHAFAESYGMPSLKASLIQEQEQKQEQEPEKDSQKHLVAQQENIPLETVLKRLNELREKSWEWSSYKPLTSKHKTNTEHITALLNDGSTADELIVVLEYLAEKNKGHEPSRQYFNCVTPFRPKNWENNLAMAADWDAKGRPSLNGGKEKSNGASNAMHFDDDDKAAEMFASRMQGGL